MKLMIGLAGLRGSGKTTIAQQLAYSFGFERASFGAVVRAEAIRRGLKQDLTTLQHLGLALIEEFGWRRFCDAVLAPVAEAERVVVDGVRHVPAVETLRVLAAPGSFCLAYVEVGEEIRSQRLVKRDNAPAHPESDEPAECDVPLLRSLAKVVVNGTSSDAAADIVAVASYS